MQPFDYQKQCLVALRESRPSGRALMVMASGLGKTLTAAWDIKTWLNEHPTERVLVLCHQKEIMAHLETTLRNVLNDQYSIGCFHAQKKATDSQITLSLFQTIRTWRHSFAPKTFGYVLVDEGHHSEAPTYKATLRYFKPEFIMGMTATPDRMDDANIRDTFGQPVFELPLERALAEGKLTPTDYRLMTDELADLNTINTPEDKLSIAKLNRWLFVPKRDQEIAVTIKEKLVEVFGTTDVKVCVFCQSIEHANQFSDVFGAVPIHSGISDHERKARLENLNSGSIKAITAVDIFNEGIDVPDLACVVFLRSTGSQTIFLQQLGRGLRKSTGKKKLLILDYVCNCERMIMINELRKRLLKEQRTYQARVIFPIECDTPITFNFEEKQVVNVIALLSKIRTLAWTQAEIIILLQTMATKLGRTPTKPGINTASKKGLCCSVGTITYHFGSYNAALQAAGLELNKVK